MLKNLQNIGLLNYSLTILFGKTRNLLHIVKYNQTNEHKGKELDFIYGDFIVTMGKKAIILTNQIEGKRREPYVVKKWSNITEKSESDELLFKIKIFLYWLKSFLSLLPHLLKSYFQNRKEFSRLIKSFKNYKHNYFNSKGKIYIDNDDLKWIYVKDDDLKIEWLSICNRNGEIEYKFIIKQGYS